MGEKVKRWRPSLTAYRALENDLSVAFEQNRLLSLEVTRLKCDLDDASDTVSMLVKDCDAWRDKFRALVSRGFISRLLNRLPKTDA